MSTRALEIVDRLIDQVSALAAAPSAASSSPKPTSSSSSVSSSPAVSAASTAAPRTTIDVAWFPLVPLGHTEFSWGLTLAESSSSSPATTTAAPSLTAPAPSSITTTSENAKPSKEQKQPKEPKQSKEAKQPKEAKAAPAATAALIDPNQPPFSRLDIRVGQIKKAWKHPDADSLYVEEIDVGEDQPRQVVSGLVKFVPQEEMEKARVLVICNLKPSPLRKITSYGMVLAASNADHTVVELIQPPVGVAPGTRLTLDGVDVLAYKPDAEVDPKKKQNAWELIKDGLKTNESGEATWNGHKFVINGASCTSKTLVNSTIA